MKDSKIVTIGGQKYDSITGLPINHSKNNPSLNDVKKPLKTTKPDRGSTSVIRSFRATAKTHVAKSMDIARSKSIVHFSNQVPKQDSKDHRPQPQTISKQSLDIKPSKHPLAAKVEQIRQNQIKSATKTLAHKAPKQIKEEAITEAIKKADAIKNTEKEKNKSQKPKWHKVILVISCVIATIALIGIVSYIFLPSMSIYIASSQTKVNAKLPTYVPDGYNISGPISAENGKVVTNFSNANNSYFKLAQSSSSWDSSALKNKINNDSKGEFITTTFDGLTLFTYDSNAAWINDGVLYTISGNAQLSSDQIRQIALSLCS